MTTATGGGSERGQGSGGVDEPEGREPAAGPWLVVIDMQTAFARPDSAWAVPRYSEIEPVVRRLCDDFERRTVVTRFVPDPAEPGQWARYYDRWPTMRAPADDPLWDVTLPLPDSTPVVSLPTFGKWGSELDRITEGAPLVVCGVATDCCVLATVLAAVDAGRAVTLVADACAGVGDEYHEETLHVLGLLSPMVEIRRAAEIGNDPERLKALAR